jgi:ABC-type transport system involved in cytochrome c biogenesis permease subunit
MPWILVIVFAVWVAGAVRQKPETGFQTREFGQLPVLLNGRIQPMDSVARNALLQVRSRQAVFLEDESKKGGMFPVGTNLTATEWLMGVMMKPEIADDQKVFRIESPDLLAALKLPEKEKYFSFNQLSPVYDEIGKQAERIQQREEAKTSTVSDRTPFEKQVMKLSNALFIYQRLKVSLRPPESDNYTAELAQCLKDVDVLRSNKVDGKELDDATMQRLSKTIGGFDAIARFAYMLVVPPADPKVSRDNWENIGASLTNSIAEKRIDPAVASYAAMVTTYRQNNVAAFNQSLAEYRQWLGAEFKPELKKGGSEFFFNSFEPFYKAMIIYVAALILGLFSLLLYTALPSGSEGLRRAAFSLVCLAWVIHTFGLIYRMVLEGRPPVTNLYSSAIFIGWGAVVFGAFLEMIFRVGIGSMVAAVAGFVTLVIAHNLAIGGDTMEMLRAVLDTNFWLSTHVTTVTMGYASTFVAGLLAVIYVLFGFFTPLLSQKSKTGGQIDVGKILAKMVYAIVCFATLFSFVGTVLGGIWADQSWGRFWGWDPKENGALLIVIWNAMILHARWGGMVRERGIMNMAIFGNIVTSFSWFGVNMLGIGLHSYGFMDAAFKWLVLFIISQVALIGLGLVPKRYWRSFSEEAGVTTKVPEGGKSKPSPAGA